MHNECMPTIQIRNVPEELHQKLVERARREGRSLTQEAITLLRLGLAQEENPRERRRRLFAEWDANPIRIKGSLPPHEQLVDEDHRR